MPRIREDDAVKARIEAEVEEWLKRRRLEKAPSSGTAVAFAAGACLQLPDDSMIPEGPVTSISRREKEKKKEEEKDEEAEIYSNFLLFAVLGLAALIRFICKACIMETCS